MQDQPKVVGGDCVTADVEILKCSKNKLPPDESMRLWRLARREVSKKWDILKVCSDRPGKNLDLRILDPEEHLEKS